MLVLRAAGLTRRRIAAELGLSEHTVRAHVAHAYEKLGVHCLIDALRSVGLLD